jgi:hypothetical protein
MPQPQGERELPARRDAEYRGAPGGQRDPNRDRASKAGEYSRSRSVSSASAAVIAVKLCSVTR